MGCRIPRELEVLIDQPAKPRMKLLTKTLTVLRAHQIGNGLPNFRFCTAIVRCGNFLQRLQNIVWKCF